MTTEDVTPEGRMAIVDMSDREFAVWFAIRMNRWVSELHAQNVAIPVEVSFALGAAGGILVRLTSSKE